VTEVPFIALISNIAALKGINITEKTRLTLSMLVSRMINAMRNPALISYQTILCIKDDEIGDMCYATPVFEMLRKQYPSAIITLICKPFNKAFLHADRNIDRIETEWSQLSKTYDLIVDLRISWKSIFFALRKWPKARLDRGTIRFADSALGVYPHELETNYKVVEPLISQANKTKKPTLTLSGEDLVESENFIAEHQLGHFALLHISSRRALKKWPSANFIALAGYLFHERNLQVVFIGDSSEIDDIENVRKQIEFTTFSTAGKLSLSALGSLMKKATIYIGNDSGPLHIAAILNVPALGLYGPGPPDIFYPAGNKTAVIHHVLPCNPCDQIHCVIPDNPCIARITQAEVIEKIKLLLD
jgi:ADP-heptose:LPS heptosyltransferase